MTIQKILYPLLLFFCLLNASGQEVVTGLQTNFSIRKYDNIKVSKSLTTADTLALPFFDDFSGHQVYPDIKKWIDDFVFINNTYSDRQITTGIATLDALDNTGHLYENVNSSGFEADNLTSLPLDLNYSASDNIWLSFFYQPGGLGDLPETKDSLVLQFLAPGENKWYSIWQTAGNTDQRFKPVILRIDNARYLKKGFQFRFVNYASLSPNLTDPSMVGNCDIWNIDYILLDKNRNKADTVFHDVAFRLPLRSLLKTHEAMPWKQFKQVYLQEMGSVIPVHYRNNDIITRNVTRNFEISDMYSNSESYFFSAGATNISPATSIDYDANLVYTYGNENNDSALFKVTCSLKTDEFDPKANDTLIYYQHFENYFAFDDGTSEGGYGINGLGSRNAMAAYRFKSFMEDTLRAIQICFNDSYLDANKRSFDLVIWDDNNGIPGDVKYTLEEVMVEQGDMVNGFYTYKLTEGVPVNNLFYVGWKQRTETFLNAGLDLNTPNAGRQFYWLNGQWQESQVKGSIMIRPVVGDPLKTTSIDDVIYSNRNPIRIWPNPANDFINIDPGELQLSQSADISIFDIQGREIMKLAFSNTIDVSLLKRGIYIVIVRINGKLAGYNRMIITR